MQDITKDELVEIIQTAVRHQPNMPVQMNNEGGENSSFLSSAKNVVIAVLTAIILAAGSIQYARNDTSLRFEVKMETQYASLVEKLDNLLSKYDEVQKELHDRTADRITKSVFKEEISIRDSKINNLENTQDELQNKFRELEFIVKNKK